MYPSSDKTNHPTINETSRRGRDKETGGLQATIERLTGKTPCPKHLRDAGNKYLNTPLFPASRKTSLSVQEKLKLPNADTLLMNALTLDEVFRGKTPAVVEIIDGKINKVQLAALIKDAESEMKRRFEVYAYWNQRITALRSVLLDQDLDLKTASLNEQLNKYEPGTQLKPAVSFALRAVQQLENVEESGRLARPTANEYAAQADAYMALGDYAKAGKKARQAVDMDPQHARGWFLRVMAAVKQRSAAAREMQHQRLVATEIAEPMSAHESMAYELENEAASEASRHHEHLAAILPQAILHWPRLNQWQYEHEDQRIIVRDLFLEHAFALISLGSSPCRTRTVFLVNGLGPEWGLKYDNPEINKFIEETEIAELPFGDVERSALTQLVAEYDKHPYTFFTPVGRPYLCNDLKLLHLRWVLNMQGYEQHWKRLSENFLGFPASIFEYEILGNDRLASLWQMHQALHGGAPSVLTVLTHWQNKTTKDRQAQTSMLLLRRYAGLYHHQFARREFTCSINTARLAQQVTGDKNARGGTSPHPLEDIDTPIQNALYWQYLEALAVIEGALSGASLDEIAKNLLLNAEHWCAAFKQTEFCFWVFSEEYEGGGGEDYEIEPYQQDLRSKSVWLAAAKAQLHHLTGGSYADQLERVAEALSIVAME